MATKAEPTTTPTDNPTMQPEAHPNGPASDREERIRERAYAAAERRGFEPGHEHDDWLQAEQEIDAPDTGDTSQRESAQP